MTDTQPIIDVATRAATPDVVEPGDLLSIVVPVDGEHKLVDLEKYASRPNRKRRDAQMHTAGALTQYVNAHKVATESTLWADKLALKVVGILNDHAEQAQPAGWRDHRATFTARLTKEWQAWNAKSGTYAGQAEFAEFLEDHVADVVNPTAADLLELAKTFEATKGCEFRGAVRLDSGQRQMTYVETIDAKAGQQGQLTVPATIELGLVPFEGADPYKVVAKFRYRLEGGSLKLGVVLDRPDLVLAAAFDETVAKVEEATGLLAYRGTP